MLKHLSAIVIPFCVLAVIYSEVVETPFYSEAELQHVREISVQLARDGDYQQALERFEALIDIADENQLVWADYVTVLNWAGKHQQAVQYADKLNPEVAPLYALEALFDSLLATEHFPEALRIAEIALSKAEQKAQWGADKVELLVHRSRYEEAGRLNDLVLKSSPDDQRSLVQQAIISEALHPNTHREQLVALFARFPDDTAVQSLLASSAVHEAREGNQQSALELLSLLHEKNPGHQQILADYLTVLIWNEQYDKGLELFAGATNVPLYAEAAAAKANYETGHYPEAENLYRKLVQNDPDNFEYQLGLANALQRQNQSQQALQILHSLHENNRQNSQFLLAIARAYHGVARTDPTQFDLALDSYQQLFRLDDTDDEAVYREWFVVAEQATARRGYARYRQRLQSVFSRPDISPALLADYLALVLRHDDYQTAQRLLAKIEPRTLSEKIVEKTARTRRSNKQFRQAQALYSWAQRQFPDNLQLKLGLALVYSERGVQDQADQVFAYLTSHYPHNRQVQDAAIYHYRQYRNYPELAAALARNAANTHGRADYLNAWLETVMDEKWELTEDQRLQRLTSLQQQYADRPVLSAKTALYLVKYHQCDRANTLTNGLINDRDAATLSSRLLEDLAFATKSCGNFSLAKNLYKTGVETYPDRAAFAAGELLMEAELGAEENLRRLIALYSNRYQHQQEFVMAKGSALASLKDYPVARDTYLEAVRQWPENGEAYQQWVMMTNYAGDSEQAIALASRKSYWFDNTHWRRLYADRAAHSIRQAGQSGNRALHDKALREVDQYLEFLGKNFPDDLASRNSALMDRTVALSNSGAHAESIDQYQQLALAPQETPVYVVVAVADAYSQLRQPEAALHLLQQASHQLPRDPELLVRLYYSYLDTEQYARAKSTLTVLQGLFDTRDYGGVHWTENMGAMFDAYSNNRDLAQMALERYAVRDPDNIAVKTDLATVYRWRGWPERSLQVLESASAIDPDSVVAQVGQVYAHQDLWQFDKLHSKADQLNREHGANESVKRLNRDIGLRHMRELDSRISRGRSSGGGTFGNEDLTFETRLYDQPYQENFRPFAHHYYSRAEFSEEEGNGELERLGAGVQYRNDKVELNTELSQTLNGHGDIGLSVNGTWRLDDFWSIAADLQSYSLLVPIRAINADLDGESVTFSVKHAWHEARRAKVSFSWLDISDGNTRSSIYASHYHRIYANEHHEVSLIEQAYYADNSEQTDEPYFNPESETMVGLALEYQGILHRRYERKWMHRLNIGAGAYDQKEFSTDGIWDIEYEHIWQPSDTLRLNLGVMHRDRTYDGDGEHYNAIYAGINWRF